MHNGDLGPRRAIWSRNEPVRILGAMRNATGQHEVEEGLTFVERMFSGCTSYEFERLAGSGSNERYLAVDVVTKKTSLGSVDMLMVEAA